MLLYFWLSKEKKKKRPDNLLNKKHTNRQSKVSLYSSARL